MPVEVVKDGCTPEETVEHIRATPANPAQIRPSAVDLAGALQAAPSDSAFDLECWRRQWSEVEAELKSLTSANAVAEGRSR